MKKITATILLAILAISIQAQEMPSVLGIKFGSSYETTKKALEERLGYVTNEGGNLKTSEIYLGTFMFHFGTFYFQRTSTQSYLSGANFSRWFSLNNKTGAINFRDTLKELLSSKYGYTEEYTNSDEFKCYRIGEDPTRFNTALILLTLFKANSRGGETLYYVDLDYGPMSFVEDDSDF